MQSFRIYLKHIFFSRNFRFRYNWWFALDRKLLLNLVKYSSIDRLIGLFVSFICMRSIFQAMKFMAAAAVVADITTIMATIQEVQDHHHTITSIGVSIN